jgi:hypothetical protein
LLLILSVMNTTRLQSDEEVFRALRHQIAEKFASDLAAILARVTASHAGRPIDVVLDEICEQVRGRGFEPDRELLRPHASGISTLTAGVPDQRTP